MAYRQDLHELLEPAVQAVGFELVGVEFVAQGRYSVLRIYIDRPEGITVDDCELASKQVSAILDVEDPINGNYNLEVSSPGLERPLFKLEHFEQAINKIVSIQMQSTINGRRKFSGVISGVEQGIVILQGKDKDEFVKLPWSQITKANLVYSE